MDGEPKPHAPKGRLKANPISLSHPLSVKPSGPRGCTAHNNRGELCKFSAIPGGTVCRFHGGNAPQVRQAAEERLQALVHPAITRLGQLVDQTEFPSVAIAAVKDVLDRNMGKAVEKQTVEHTGGIEITWKVARNRVEDDSENSLNP